MPDGNPQNPPIPVGARVRLVPEGKVAQVFRCEEQAGRYVVGLIFEETNEAKTFVLTREELFHRLQVIPTLREAFAAGAEVLPRDQVVAFAEALRMRLAYAFDPHYAVSVTQVDLLPHQRGRSWGSPIPGHDWTLLGMRRVAAERSMTRHRNWEGYPL